MRGICTHAQPGGKGDPHLRKDRGRDGGLGGLAAGAGGRLEEMIFYMDDQ